MKNKKISIWVIVLLFLTVSIFPYKKDINNLYNTTDYGGKKITVGIKGTYHNYLIRKDTFKGTLTDEAGRKYVAVDKMDLIEQTIGLKEEVAMGVTFVSQDINMQETSFAIVYFDKKFESVYQCDFIK